MDKSIKALHDNWSWALTTGRDSSAAIKSDHLKLSSAEVGAYRVVAAQPLSD